MLTFILAIVAALFVGAALGMFIMESIDEYVDRRS